MAIMRRNLLSYASSRLVVVPLGNRVSRVRRFSFPRKVAALGITGAGKELKCCQTNMSQSAESGIAVILSLSA